MSTSFRERLRRGDRLIGMIVSVGSTDVVEVVAASGFDWLFIDAEHSPLSPATVQQMVLAAGAVPCLVRLPANDEVFIKQVLDSGAAGIIVPLVNSALEAESVVRRAKYPPQGMRGVGTSRALGYGYGIADYVARANQETVVLVQAEHIEAVHAIDAIAAVPGLDGIFVGPFDLSASMGKPGQVNDPDVVAAIDQISAAARRAGLPLGYFGVSPETVAPMMARGFSLLACGVDLMMLGTKARETVAALRA